MVARYRLSPMQTLLHTYAGSTWAPKRAFVGVRLDCISEQPTNAITAT